MGCFSSDDVEAPAKSQEEIQLIEDQSALLEQYMSEQEELRPILLESSGYKYAETGNLIPKTLTKEEQGELYLQQNPDVAASSFASDPWQHYQKWGKAEGRTWATTTGEMVPETKLVKMTDAEKYAAMSASEKAAYDKYMLSMGLSSTGEKLTDDEYLASLSPTERESYLQSTSLYRTQMAQLGYNPDTGSVMTEEEQLASMTPLQRQEYEASLLQEKRDSAAAKHNLLLMGLDEEGNALSEETMLAGMTAAEKLSYNLTKATGERQMLALEGKLPISSKLEQELTDSENQAVENLKQKLGPNWELSTSGQSAIAKIKQANEIVRDTARRGEITDLSGITSSREALNLQKTGGTTSKLSSGSSYSEGVRGILTGADILGDTGSNLALAKTYSDSGLTSMYGLTSDKLSGSSTLSNMLASYRGTDNSTSIAMQNSANAAAQKSGLISAGAGTALAVIAYAV